MPILKAYTGDLCPNCGQISEPKAKKSQAWVWGLHCIDFAANPCLGGTITLKPRPKPRFWASLQKLGHREGTTKKLCDKDFAERSSELSGATCLKTLVLLGNDR